MAEKLGQQPRIELQTSDDQKRWLSEAIHQILTHQAVDTKVAVNILWNKTLTELKTATASSEWAENIPGTDIEKRVDFADKLYTIADEILTKGELANLEALSNSNKFRLLKLTAITEGDIFDERRKFIEKSQHIDLKTPVARELAQSKQIISEIIDRLLAEDGVQKMTDLKTVHETSPEIAADLGKMFEALKIIKLHDARLKRIEQKQAERTARLAELTGRIRRDEGKPIVYLRELIDTIDLGEYRKQLTFFDEDEAPVATDMKDYRPTKDEDLWSSEGHTKH